MADETKQINLKIDGSSGSVFIEEEMAKLMCEVFETFKKKQANYGKGNIAKFGERGVLIRCNDKIERLINLVWNGKPNALADESIEDTWEDLADCGLIALLVRRGVWDKI